MVETKEHFLARIDTISERHAALSRFGYTLRLHDNGTLYAEPRMAPSRVSLKYVWSMVSALFRAKAAGRSARWPALSPVHSSQ